MANFNYSYVPRVWYARRKKEKVAAGMLGTTDSKGGGEGAKQHITTLVVMETLM